MNVAFEDVLRMVADACGKVWNNGTYAKEETVLECATKIYIEMNNQGGSDTNVENKA